MISRTGGRILRLRRGTSGSGRASTAPSVVSWCSTGCRRSATRSRHRSPPWRRKWRISVLPRRLPHLVSRSRETSMNRSRSSSEAWRVAPVQAPSSTSATCCASPADSTGPSSRCHSPCSTPQRSSPDSRRAAPFRGSSRIRWRSSRRCRRSRRTRPRSLLRTTRHQDRRRS